MYIYIYIILNNNFSYFSPLRNAYCALWGKEFIFTCSDSSPQKVFSQPSAMERPPVCYQAILGTDVLCQAGKRHAGHAPVLVMWNRPAFTMKEVGDPAIFHDFQSCSCHAPWSSPSFCREAKSGMGKTAVFVLACLQQVDSSEKAGISVGTWGCGNESIPNMRQPQTKHPETIV